MASYQNIQAALWRWKQAMLAQQRAFEAQRDALEKVMDEHERQMAKCWKEVHEAVASYKAEVSEGPSDDGYCYSDDDEEFYEGLSFEEMKAKKEAFEAAVTPHYNYLKSLGLSQMALSNMLNAQSMTPPLYSAILRVIRGTFTDEGSKASEEAS